MILQDLPDELFQQILFQAVIARGVKRGLRLRLVCRLFSNKVLPALFESRLLDNFYASTIVSEWYLQNDHGASAFWHSYLVYRVQNERSTGQHRFLDIRRVSEAIFEEAQLDLTTTVKALCWPALQDVMWHSYPTGAIAKGLSSPELDLLCAAAYLSVIPLAKRLLHEGHRPTSVSHIFCFSPIGLAAWAGNAEIIQLFQENLPEYDENGLRDSITGVAIRGDTTLARLAIYPPSRAKPDSTDVAGQQFGKLDRCEGAGRAIHLAQWSTTNVELYQYFEGFFEEPDSQKIRNSILVKNALVGNLKMVRYLLDTGADIRGTMGRWGNPLCCAIHGCHGDVFDLLLERGADPNYSGDWERVQGRKPILTAAQAGSLAIVRKLIDHGGHLSLPRYGESILKAAVLTENTAMVKLLLDLGVGPGKNEELARAQGLESMVEMLRLGTSSLNE